VKAGGLPAIGRNEQKLDVRHIGVWEYKDFGVSLSITIKYAAMCCRWFRAVFWTLASIQLRYRIFKPAPSLPIATSFCQRSESAW
jgi:hypothetical protein